MLATIRRTYPSTGAWQRPGPQVRIRNQVAYESASLAPRTIGWYAPTLGPNDALLPNLRTMRDRAREARRNNGYARRIVRILVSEMIGTGITPQSQAPDRAFRRRVDALWKRSARELNANDDGLDVYGLQLQAVTCWLEAGECFVRRRLRLPSDGLAVPIQFQLLEPEFVPHDEDGAALALTPPGHRVRAGIEFSPIGRRVAYHMRRVRAGEPTDFFTPERVRIPATDVFHLYAPERPGQLRGVPTLAQALVTLRDLRGANDATLLRYKLANLFVGWVEDVSASTDASGVPVDPVTGAPIERATDGTALVKLEPGILLHPPAGQKLTFNDPPGVGPEFEAFNRQYLRELAAAGEVPYHSLTGDMAQVNDRTIRVIVQEFRRYLEQLQWLIVIPLFCEPLWRAWLRRAVDSGALEAPAGFDDEFDTWAAVDWQPQAWSYIHPVQDVQADKERVRSGFATKRQIIRERGFDPERIEEERREELAAADAAGLVDETDPRQDAPRAATPAPPPAEPDGEERDAR